MENERAARDAIKAMQEYEVLEGVGHFFDADPLPLDFVLPGLLRKSVGVLVAAGSTGKSFLAVEACMTIAAGKDVFGLFGGGDITAGSVAYVALEDPLDVFWHRIHGIGKYLEENLSEDDYKLIRGGLDNIHLHSLYGRGYRPMKSDDLTASPHFKQTVERVKAQGARLVVVDTYSRFLAGHSESDNAIASTLVSILEQLCSEANCAVLVIHHTNKASQFSGEQGNQGAARGASALTDNARYQLNMWTMPQADAERYGVDDEERKRYVFAEATKANHMPPQGMRWLQRQAGGVLIGIDALDETPRGRLRRPGGEYDG
ncbi:helicase RepA family protein [Sulfitobacter indolifex]|jgi:RecA-family ATPase|uniref:helicase RepA family protein n=1 Tax=Sulfitobacter indolifex TaxID=225422 RepID=UPI001FAD4DF3|nr:helicase RepA family protein [Sulfitobacter indolifex]